MSASRQAATPPRFQQAPGVQVWSAMTVLYVVWGSTYLAIAVVGQSVPPLLAMSMRFLTASALLGALLIVKQGWRVLRVPWRELRGAVVVGVLLLGCGMGMVTIAEQYVPSGIVALIVAVMPVWVVLLRTVTGDRPRLATWLGVFLGFAGLVILVHPGADVANVPGATDEQRALWSMLLPLGTMCWAFGSFLQPRIRTPRDPLVLSTYEMFAGSAALGLAGLVSGEDPSGLVEGTSASWWAWVYLVVIGSLLAYSTYVWVVGHAPLSLVSTYAYVNPVVAVLLGFVILREPITGGLLVGGIVILGGVALVVSGERQRGLRVARR